MDSENETHTQREERALRNDPTILISPFVHKTRNTFIHSRAWESILFWCVQEKPRRNAVTEHENEYIFH